MYIQNRYTIETTLQTGTKSVHARQDLQGTYVRRRGKIYSARATAKLVTVQKI